MPLYCDVALPVPLRLAFTYAVPEAFAGEELIGRRIVVPFRNRAMVGVGVAVSDQKPDNTRLKEIVELLDPVPALAPPLLELGKWVSRYYLAPLGETLRTMLPPEIEIRYDREFSITPEGGEYLLKLAQPLLGDASQIAEWEVLSLLNASPVPLPFARLRKIPLGPAAAEKLRRRGLLAAQGVSVHRKIRTKKIVAWNPVAEAAPASPADERVRDILAATRGPMPLAFLLQEAKVSKTVVQRLEKKGMLLSWEEAVTSEEDRWDTDFIPPSNVLNPEQRSALDEIQKWLATREFVAGLLHGVTGSGKTEVYLGAVEAAIAQGRSALILVPEIALTLWLSRLVRARFGAGVAVLHSGLPENERAREWWRVRHGDARIVVGTRSAVFAPVENLGLVIVDEEQEASYKQEEIPRYHGRDTAVMRARLEGAVALLGSATPSMETYQNARSGKYRLLELQMRVENRPLAAVQIVDLRSEFKRSHNAAPLSDTLRTAIAQRLESGTQAMVLINRRGYSWSQLCRSCGATAQCQNCSIALTYHKRRNRLICHYCGYSIVPPKECPKCRGDYLYFVGDGAERIEEYLVQQFPTARVARLDRDSVRTKREFQKVLGAFANGELDILVGTQMVAKGHDFERVTLVGVVSSDLALARPDFRAAERAFQLFTQVAGRAGRGRLPGEVLIESYYPEHYAIQLAVKQDYFSFFEKEVHFRRLMHYPPFTYLANILVRDKKIENAIRWSRAIGSYFAPFESKGIKVLGPAAAPLARLREEYRFQFLLKTQRRAVLTEALSGCLDFCAEKELPATAVIVDVDPMTLS
jgi:primosomal protein N' (replication factor Y)